MRSIVFTVILASLVTSIAGQENRVLLPFTEGSVLGANGATWTVETRAFNDDSEAVYIRLEGTPCPPFSAVGLCEVLLEPQEQVVLSGLDDRSIDSGNVYTILSDELTTIHFASHLYLDTGDGHRHATELPVVRFSDLTNRAVLNNVAPHPGARSMLRIYVVQSLLSPLAVLELAVYPLDEEPGSPLVERIIHPQPGRAVVIANALQELGISGKGERYVIRVSTTDPANLSKVWLVLSVTDNQTNYVTLHTPQ